ncbi:MAG: DUF6624 domain-containing protein [Gemmataceae bacterium]
MFSALFITGFGLFFLADPPVTVKPAEATVKEPALRQELLDRVKKDQDARFKLIALNPVGASKEVREKNQAALKVAMESLAAIDTENRNWLKERIEKEGWPTISRVGKDGAHAAWLLVQHADSNREFQKECLKKIEVAVANKEAAPIDLAYLTDRVLTGEGKKQRYGTQLKIVDGKFVVSPVEDEDKLDERRKSLGMPTMAEYLKSAEAMYRNEQPKKK